MRTDGVLITSVYATNDENKLYTLPAMYATVCHRCRHEPYQRVISGENEAYLRVIMYCIWWLDSQLVLEVKISTNLPIKRYLSCQG